MRTALAAALLAATALCALAAGAGAQSEPAPPWFGAPLPAGLGDPHQPVLRVSTLQPAAAVVPAGEGGNHELEGAAIRKHLEAIVGFAVADRRRGEKAWGRITGFRAADDTHQWVAQQFTAAGLQDVQTQTYDSTSATWHPRAWEVRLVATPAAGAGARDVVLESAFPTSGSRLTGGPITAPLVYVGAVRDAALSDVDVKGKVAVQRLHPQGGAYSERTRTTERARALAARGAVAILNVIEQAGNMHVRDFSNCGVPCFNIGSADGAFLDAVMQRAASAGTAGDLQVRVSLDAAMLEGLVGHNTIGTVAGRRADESRDRQRPCGRLVRRGRRQRRRSGRADCARAALLEA